MSYSGWYKIINKDKFLKPVDKHMDSFKEVNDDWFINYKSSLELQTFKFIDENEKIKKWSLEPFPIYYIKPTDGKPHRYYFDLYLETENEKILVEIKPKSEVLPPKLPKKRSKSSMKTYQKALITYKINQSKWQAANEFAKRNNLKFALLTEDQIKNF